MDDQRYIEMLRISEANEEVGTQIEHEQSLDASFEKERESREFDRWAEKSAELYIPEDSAPAISEDIDELAEEIDF